MLTPTQKDLLEQINDFDTMIEMADGKMRDVLLIRRAQCVDKLPFDLYLEYMNIPTKDLNFKLN